MAHAEDLLKHSIDGEQREKIARYEERSESMPKMLSHVVGAFIVDSALGTNWTTASGRFKTDWPVSCRIFNVTAVNGPDMQTLHDMPASIRKKHTAENYMIASKAVKELNSVGVKAFVKTHQAFHNGRRDVLIDQALICLPHIDLQGKSPDVKYQRDIGSAEIMLAYLINKDWIKPNEIPVEDVVHGRAVDSAFGRGIFKASQSAEVQEKLALLKRYSAEPSANLGILER